MESKILLYDELKKSVVEWRRKIRKGDIVLCHGCFDIVHPGHIRHLKFAKEQGDFLVVSITPDTCIQKDSNRPMVPEMLRAENLAALEMVDAVVIAPGETALEPIELIHPDIYVKGSEYAQSKDPRFLKEKNAVEHFGGKVAYSSGDVVFSSTEIIRAAELYVAENEKLKYICKRYQIERSLIDDAIDSACKKKVLIVGEAIIDEYLYCDPVGIAQQSPVLSISLNHQHRFIGGAGALAEHLASLGMTVTFLSSMNSDHPDYSYYKMHLKNAKVSFACVSEEQRDVVVKSHFFAEDNQVLQVDHGKYCPLYSNLRSQMISRFRVAIKEHPDVIVFYDYGFGLLTPDLLESMSQIAHRNDIPVYSSIALTLRTQLDKFSCSDLFSAGEAEIRSCMHDYESGLSVLVDKFYHSTEIEELYLMLSDGSSLFFRRPAKPGIHNMESVHIPNLHPQIKDKLGRGEAFLAGLILGRTCQASEVQSIYLAGVCSAIHLRKIGNIPLTREALYRLLDERKEL